MLEDFYSFDEHLLTGCPTQPMKDYVGTLTKIINLEPYQKMFSIAREISSPPLFCASKAETFGDEMGWFRALGLPVSFCDDPLNYFESLMAARSSWCMIIVDCDAFGGDPAFLANLRATIRSDFDIPFILVSRENKTSNYWHAQSPRVLSVLDDELSIDTLEDTVLSVLGTDDLYLHKIASASGH